MNAIANPAASAQWNRMLDALREAGYFIFNWPLGQSEIARAKRSGICSVCCMACF